MILIYIKWIKWLFAPSLVTLHDNVIFLYKKKSGLKEEWNHTQIISNLQHTHIKPIHTDVNASFFQLSQSMIKKKSAML
jgi:hypothetical protein